LSKTLINSNYTIKYVYLQWWIVRQVRDYKNLFILQQNATKHKMINMNASNNSFGL